jgi:hypothetical protein
MEYNELMPKGISQFTIGASPCLGIGYSITKKDIENALKGKVYENHHSTDDLENLRFELNLEDTGFGDAELNETFTSFNGLEPWRIGESFAESWLEVHRQCLFPWKTQFDIRSLKASLPGVDMVGITNRGNEQYFAFGEVKTSSDSNNPPGVMVKKA